MFIKEVATTILPWWVLGCIVFGQTASMRMVLLLIGAYMLATEIHFKQAKRESKKFGFRRIVRIPVNRWLLKFLSRGRFVVPEGVTCYILHVVSEKLVDPRTFFLELESDIKKGVEAEAFYVGNTFVDLEHRVNRVVGRSFAKTVAGTFLPGQTWNVDPEWQQRLLFGRTFSKKKKLLWKILILDTRRSQ